jgi:hypothetical protein
VPLMNGFRGFCEDLQRPAREKTTVVIIMLTTSSSPATWLVGDHPLLPAPHQTPHPRQSSMSAAERFGHSARRLTEQLPS